MDEIYARLLKSPFDEVVYKSLLDLKGYPKSVLDSFLKTYKSTRRKEDKIELLRKAAKDAENMKIDRYRQYYPHEIIGDEIVKAVKENRK
jgi:hypothetical protein